MMRNMGFRRVASFIVSGAMLFCASFAGFAQSSRAAGAAAKAPVTVPFVGCASDGQAGPTDPPLGKPHPVAIAPQLARQLAWYQAAEGVGVLAPRGWHCFGTYGSSGNSLFVSPEPITASDRFSGNWKGLPGTAIQLSMDDGGTSGRFEVAKVIARVFPDHMAFVRGVIAEKLEPATEFPRGPYPADKLIYRGGDTVEYETPAASTGLGTISWLQKNDSPIRGVVILFGPDTSLLHLSMRLPATMAALEDVIIHQTELEAAAMATDN